MLTLQGELKGDNHLKNFLKKKFVRIYIPWFVNAIFLILLFRIYEIKKITLALFAFNTIYRDEVYNWYIIMLLYFYLVFYLVSKNNLKANIKYLIFLISSLLWIVICIFLNLPSNWYNTVFCFPVGCYICDYRNNLNEIFDKHYNKSFCGSLIFFIFTIILSKVVDNKYMSIIIFQNLSSITIIIFMVILLMKTQLNNKFLEFCGKISYEIFLIATGIIVYYYDNFAPKGYSIIIISILIIVAASIVNSISNIIVQKMIN